MAWVHQIKFFFKDEELYAALYDDSHISEFWIANIKASDIGIPELPKNFLTERKYRIEDLNIPSFEYSQDNFLFKVGDFVNRIVKGKPFPKVVVENQMSGDTYNVGQAGAVGKYSHSNNNNFYQSEQHKTLAEAADEIQRLLTQLEETAPNIDELAKIHYINDETTPSFKRRVVSALQISGESALDEFILENKYLKVVKAAVKGWLHPIS